MEEILEELQKLANKKREDVQLLKEESSASQKTIAEIDSYLEQVSPDENVKNHFQALKEKFKSFDPSELDRIESELYGVEECLEIFESYLVEDDGFDDSEEQEEGQA